MSWKLTIDSEHVSTYTENIDRVVESYYKIRKGNDCDQYTQPTTLMCGALKGHISCMYNEGAFLRC